MSDNNESKRDPIYGTKVLPIDEYFRIYQEKAVGEGATEMEVFGAKMTFFAGFHAGLRAMAQLQEAPTPEESNALWSGLWNQIIEFKDTCEQTFSDIAARESLRN